MNKRIFLGAMLSASLLFSASSNADEFVNGYVAAENHEYSEAVQHWEKLAKKGDHKAQFMLGMMYHSGLIGNGPDEKTAVILYEKAAKGGNLVAQEYLAIGYREGWFGLKKSNSKASHWEKELAKAGEVR